SPAVSSCQDAPSSQAAPLSLHAALPISLPARGECKRRHGGDQKLTHGYSLLRSATRLDPGAAPVHVSRTRPDKAVSTVTRKLPQSRSNPREPVEKLPS